MATQNFEIDFLNSVKKKLPFRKKEAAFIFLGDKYKNLTSKIV